MHDSRPEGDSDAISQAEISCREAVAGLQSALETLSERRRSGLSDERSVAAFSRSWRTVCRRHRRVQALFAELAEIVEDIFDSVEAEKARLERGDSVPWEKVKAELGLS